MKKIRIDSNALSFSLKGMLIVFALTVPMWLVGRSVLGEAVICLLYLAPIAWSANQWGQLAGMSAALTAALCFDFLFLPPFYTFAVGSLEGWLVLAIFLGIAVVVVGRIQNSLSTAREATFKYELSAALATARTQDAVAHSLARYIGQLFQAMQVNVIYKSSKQVPQILVSAMPGKEPAGRPDRILAILNAWGLVGEIHIWRGEFSNLPAENSLLLQNFAFQAARAFERTQPADNERPGKELQ